MPQVLVVVQDIHRRSVRLRAGLVGVPQLLRRGHPCLVELEAQAQEAAAEDRGWLRQVLLPRVDQPPAGRVLLLGHQPRELEPSLVDQRTRFLPKVRQGILVDGTAQRVPPGEKSFALLFLQ